MGLESQAESARVIKNFVTIFEQNVIKWCNFIINPFPASHNFCCLLLSSAYALGSSLIRSYYLLP